MASKKETKTITVKPDKVETKVEVTPTSDYEPTFLVVKELMVQKGISYDEAYSLLKNPTK